MHFRIAKKASKLVEIWYYENFYWQYGNSKDQNITTHLSSHNIPKTLSMLSRVSQCFDSSTSRQFLHFKVLKKHQYLWRYDILNFFINNMAIARTKTSQPIWAATTYPKLCQCFLESLNALFAQQVDNFCILKCSKSINTCGAMIFWIYLLTIWQ